MFILPIGMLEEHGPTFRSRQTRLGSCSRRTAWQSGSAGSFRSGTS
jgi:hypothetical protein